MNNYRCIYLTESWHLVPAMARAAHEVWGDYLPDQDAQTRERFYNAIAAGARSGAEALVALDENGSFAGMAVIYPEDMPGREDLQGWLYQLYVGQKHRGLGLGTWLLSQAEAEALALGYAQLHLFTESVQGFYEGAGWQKLTDASYNGKPGTIMRKDIKAQAEQAVATGF